MPVHPARCDGAAMPEHTHEIVLKGRLGRHLLGPFVDEFVISAGDGVTRLVGTVRDTSHLHGLVAYLASINAELVAVSPVTATTDTRSAS